MFYIYIIYSDAWDKYYVGYSNDPHRRLNEHNTKPFNTFTSKYRPWKLIAIFACGEEEALAMQLEKFIKKQKSRKFIEQLCNPNFIPSGFLAQLVRVPHVRDYLLLSRHYPIQYLFYLQHSCLRDAVRQEFFNKAFVPG